jgi:hypothetical protein
MRDEGGKEHFQLSGTPDPEWGNPSDDGEVHAGNSTLFLRYDNRRLKVLRNVDAAYVRCRIDCKVKGHADLRRLISFCER